MTTTTIEALRADFEDRAFNAYFLSQIGKPKDGPLGLFQGLNPDIKTQVAFLDKQPDGSYGSDTLNAAWWAWQESHKAALAALSQEQGEEDREVCAACREETVHDGMCGSCPFLVGNPEARQPEVSEDVVLWALGTRVPEEVRSRYGYPVHYTVSDYMAGDTNENRLMMRTLLEAVSKQFPVFPTPRTEAQAVAEVRRMFGNDGMVEVKFYENCKYGLSLPVGTKLYARPTHDGGGVGHEPSRIEREAKAMYETYATNHPTCHFLPCWDELTNEQRTEWRKKAAALTPATPQGGE